MIGENPTTIRGPDTSVAFLEVQWFRPGLGKLWPVGQIRPTTPLPPFFMVLKLTIVLHFKIVFKNQKKNNTLWHGTSIWHERLYPPISKVYRATPIHSPMVWGCIRVFIADLKCCNRDHGWSSPHVLLSQSRHTGNSIARARAVLSHNILWHFVYFILRCQCPSSMWKQEKWTWNVAVEWFILLVNYIYYVTTLQLCQNNTLHANVTRSSTHGISNSQETNS